MNLKLSSALIACTMLVTAPAAFAQDEGAPADQPAAEQGRAPQAAKKKHKHKHKGHHGHRKSHR